MAQAHPYAAEIAENIRHRSNQRLSITARTLLRGFGYERRSETIISAIYAQLGRYDLTTSLTLIYPEDLDDKVEVRATKPLAPTMAPPQLITSPPGQLDLQEAAARALPATVAISTDGGIGSGFIVHPDGLVVTARHVVEEDSYSLCEVTVRVNTGMDEYQDVVGRVFRSHRQLDFALIWLMADGPFPCLPIGNPRALRHAQTVLAIGCPSGLYNTVSKGIVSNPRQPYRLIEYIQTDAAIDTGNSGGPLISADGVVGINAWIIRNVGAAKFALPIDYLTEDIATAVSKGWKNCLAATYCRACGYTDYAQPEWYCRNCGIHFATLPSEEHQP